MVHGLQCWQVHAQGLRNAGQVQTKLHEQVNEVHLLACEGVPDLGAGEVALWPGTVIQAVVVALVLMVAHVMEVMQVKE